MILIPHCQTSSPSSCFIHPSEPSRRVNCHYCSTQMGNTSENPYVHHVLLNDSIIPMPCMVQISSLIGDLFPVLLPCCLYTRIVRSVMPGPHSLNISWHPTMLPSHPTRVENDIIIHKNLSQNQCSTTSKQWALPQPLVSSS